MLQKTRYKRRQAHTIEKTLELELYARMIRHPLYDVDVPILQEGFMPLELDSGKFLPGSIGDQVRYTGRLRDFSRRSSKVRQSGTLSSSEKNSARTTL